MFMSSKYAVGDIVNIFSDCMADCKILEVLSEKEYMATAIKIHHPKQNESFFGKNKKFKIKEDKIICKISASDNDDYATALRKCLNDWGYDNGITIPCYRWNDLYIRLEALKKEYST